MESTIIIRNAQSGDVESMTQLLAELFTIEDDFMIDRKKQIEGLNLLLNDDNAQLWVAQARENIIGMVSMQRVISTAMGGNVGLIEDLIVHRAFRGMGIGTRLLTTLIDSSEAKGYLRLSLGADIRNRHAIEFYLRHGFTMSQMGLMYRI